MKTILIFVSTLDGKVTKWGEPHVRLWSSHQDQDYATSFLKEQLVDELWLTFEPKIFGLGDNFAEDAKLDINLRLIHSEKVNDQGTLITKYAVLKE